MNAISKKLTGILVSLCMLAAGLVPALAEAVAARSAYEVIPAISYNGIQTSEPSGEHIGNNKMDSYIRYDNIDFGTGKVLKTFEVEIGLDSAGGTIAVYADPRPYDEANVNYQNKEEIETSGVKVATIETVTTGGWETFVWQQSNLISVKDKKMEGAHTLYLVFNTTTCGNVKSFQFTGEDDKGYKWDFNETIAATSYDNMVKSKDNGTHIGGNNSKSLLEYKKVNFGEKKLTSVGAQIGLDPEFSGGTLLMYVAPEDQTREQVITKGNGTLIASIKTKPTTGWEDYQWQYSTEVTDEAAEITGIQSVYILFEGNTTGNLKGFILYDQAQLNPYHIISAGETDAYDGLANNGTYLGGTVTGSYARYNNCNFSNGAPNYFVASVAVPQQFAGGEIDIYANNMEAENLVGTLTISSTGDFEAYEKQFIELGETAKAKLTGVTDIFLRFTGTTGPAGNIKNFQFMSAFHSAYAKTYFGEDVSKYYGVTEGAGSYEGQNHTKFGGTNQGYWVMYESINFGDFSPESLYLIYGVGAENAGHNISVHLDSENNPAILTVPTVSTGGFSTYQKSQAYNISKITGMHDVYVKFDYSGTCDFMGIGFTPKEAGYFTLQDTLELKDGNGTVLNAGEALPAGVTELTASVQVGNNSGEDQTMSMILAVYDANDKLIKVGVQETKVIDTFVAYAPVTLDLTAVENTQGCKIKVFQWDGLNTMAPLEYKPGNGGSL